MGTEMTAPRLYDAESSRWTSRVERAESRLEQQERKLEDTRQEVDRLRWDLGRQKDDLFLLVFAIVNVIVIAVVVMSRR
jgi:tetrahydromethanopterin S-methyltransferase subunit G